MVEYTTLSSKGQIVIPKKIREQSGWGPGDQLELVWTGDRLELKKAKPVAPQPEVSVVRELLGKYKTLSDEESSASDRKKLREGLYGKLDS